LSKGKDITSREKNKIFHTEYFKQTLPKKAGENKIFIAYKTEAASSYKNMHSAGIVSPKLKTMY
jgi:hypothetical protein